VLFLTPNQQCQSTEGSALTLHSGELGSSKYWLLLLMVFMALFCTGVLYIQNRNWFYLWRNLGFWASFSVWISDSHPVLSVCISTSWCLCVCLCSWELIVQSCSARVDTRYVITAPSPLSAVLSVSHSFTLISVTLLSSSASVNIINCTTPAMVSPLVCVSVCYTSLHQPAPLVA